MRYILVDFENVPAFDESMLPVLPGAAEVILVFGPTLLKRARQSQARLQGAGTTCHLLACPKSGRNAADVALSFEFGRLVGENKPGELLSITVVSDDAIFDHLAGLESIQQNRVRFERMGRERAASLAQAARSQAEKAKKKQSAKHSPCRARQIAALQSLLSQVANIKAEWLLKLIKSRPGSLKTLNAHVGNALRHKLCFDDEAHFQDCLDATVKALFDAKVVEQTLMRRDVPPLRYPCFEG